MKRLVKSAEQIYNVGDSLFRKEAYELLQFGENIETLELELIMEDYDENQFSVICGFSPETGVYSEECVFPGQNTKEYSDLFEIVDDAEDIIIKKIEYKK